MRYSNVIISILGLVALLTTSTSVLAKSNPTSVFTGASGTVTTNISKAADTYKFTVSCDYLNLGLGSLVITGTYTGGSTVTNATATFTPTSTKVTDTIFSGVTGTYSNTATKTANGTFSSIFTYGTTTFDLTGTSHAAAITGTGGLYTLSSISGNVKPVPEASTMISFGCMLALGGLLAFGGKRRQATMNA